MALQRQGKLPTEAAPPQHLCGDHKTLGTVDADARTIATKALFSAEELLAKATAARQRAIEAGIFDYVETQQAHHCYPPLVTLSRPWSRYPHITILTGVRQGWQAAGLRPVVGGKED